MTMTPVTDKTDSVEAGRHTPGPWSLIEVEGKLCPAGAGNLSILTLVEEDGTKFAAVYHDADARLIAAAPEMLDLLLRASQADSPNEDVRTEWWEARNAAISKAEGRP